ncbi:MAG TPA: bifunctional UDP-N-acetylglucosamine diphosphorylase/glucosamine-1-phosphate N-acetyltransferase GlmU [Fimbriimonadales bacterium]|nr:bifunctional UDP-N-acetylglucosamine diphosphorylase/glucosamine-1-phosphate N-acetyltransferase GlmU [Fimbriimonadales bacterium]
MLAAGKGTRMKSETPKALFPICGVPMAELVGRAMREAGVKKPVMVVGQFVEQAREALGKNYIYAIQKKQLGTADACRTGLEALGDYNGYVLVASADTPLVTKEVFSTLFSKAKESKAICALATCEMSDPTGYGRIVRDDSGYLKRIVEEADAAREEKKISEVCTSVYVFDAKSLRNALSKLRPSKKGEFYLTDVIELFSERGNCIVVKFADSKTFLGVNTRWHLAEAEKILRMQILQRHAQEGVTIRDPHTTYIHFDVRIGKDTNIEPMTFLEGKTRIGERCQIGPCTKIKDCSIADECSVLLSHLQEAVIGKGTRVGPFANVRTGTKIGENARIGNFVEVKNSEIGKNASIAHLSYIGDSTVGESANVGAGTITCNFDGFQKNRTVIGAGAFIGSNTTLIAPVTIGDRAITGAGSVINEDVPPDALAIGRAKQINKENWAKEWRQKRTKRAKKS